MIQIQVWLNDIPSYPTGGLGGGVMPPHTPTVMVNAAGVVVEPEGELIFVDVDGDPIECYARGTWSRWKLVA